VSASKKEAALIAQLEKPAGWTEAQHLEAARHHGDERADLKEKLSKMRLKRNATVEDEEKFRAKRAELEALIALHHEISQKHVVWSRTAYREQSDYERYFKGRV
jgi:hypothetical protein